MLVNCITSFNVSFSLLLSLDYWCGTREVHQPEKKDFLSFQVFQCWFYGKTNKSLAKTGSMRSSHVNFLKKFCLCSVLAYAIITVIATVLRINDFIELCVISYVTREFHSKPNAPVKHSKWNTHEYIISYRITNHIRRTTWIFMHNSIK